MPYNLDAARSEQVKTIVTYRPAWIIRNGITLIFLLVLLLLAVAWFIKYPDIIHAPARLTSINAPKEVKANTEGKLIRLLVKENDTVKQNQVIGYCESIARHEIIFALSANIDSMKTCLQNNQTERLPALFIINYQLLGELQPAYQTFIQAVLQFKNALNTGMYIRKKTLLLKDIENIEKMKETLAEQKSLLEKDVTISKEDYFTQEQLRSDKIIAPMDLRREESKYLSKQLSIPQINATILSNDAQLNDKNKEILELESVIAEQKSTFEQALNTLKSQVDDWKKKYLIIAPVAGKVSFATFLQENQQLTAGQTICFVTPANADYYAEMLIPQGNLGKVRENQTVIMKLESYPFQEFGTIRGKIEFISDIPYDSGYLAKVTFPNGLTTSLNRQVHYRAGLAAEANIITRDLSLLQRLFYNLKGQASY